MPPHRSFTSLPFAVALALGLASCGDEPDRASQSGREVLADVAEALNGVTSYHVEATEVGEDGRTRMSGDVSNSGSMRFTVSIGRRRGQMLVSGDDTFMKANRAFWLGREDRNRRTVARLLGGRWVKFPAASAGKLTDSLCDSDEDSTTTASDVRFSDFDKPLRIVPPRNVVDLAKLAAAVS